MANIIIDHTFTVILDLQQQLQDQGFDIGYDVVYLEVVRKGLAKATNSFLVFSTPPKEITGYKLFSSKPIYHQPRAQLIALIYQEDKHKWHICHFLHPRLKELMNILESLPEDIDVHCYDLGNAQYTTANHNVFNQFIPICPFLKTIINRFW